MSNTTAAPVTAAAVRSFFQADPARMARLSAEAQRTVQAGARGKMHAEAIKVFNAKRRTHRRYTVGNSGAVAKVTAEQRAALVAKGLTGTRGPLSKAAKAALKG